MAAVLRCEMDVPLDLEAYMQALHRPLKFAAALTAVFAVWVPATGAWASDWRTVSITVTNNTTTPAPANQTRVTEGMLPISCDGTRFSPMQRGQTQIVRCSVRGEELLTLTYSVHLGIDQLHYGTVDLDCQWRGTLTFTGSGQAVVYTKACTDPDPDGTDSGGDDGDTGDDGGDSGSGDDGGDSGSGG